MKRDLRIERVYPHPRELVWRVLTEPELLAEWLMESDFRPEIGHKFTFRTDPQPGFDGIFHCEVLELVPLERLRISWRGGPTDTVVTFQLSETILYARPATKLVLDHTGFQGLPAILTSFVLGAGWASMARRKIEPLLDVLARGEPAPPPDPKRMQHEAGRRLWWWLMQAFAPILRRAERARRKRA